VVAGAFRQEKNAQKIFERLSRLGYKARLLQIWIVSVVCSYATLLEASKSKNKFKKMMNNQQLALNSVFII
jgi:hypothetical protein